MLGISCGYLQRNQEIHVDMDPCKVSIQITRVVLWLNHQTLIRAGDKDLESGLSLTTNLEWTYASLFQSNLPYRVVVHFLYGGLVHPSSLSSLLLGFLQLRAKVGLVDKSMLLAYKGFVFLASSDSWPDNYKDRSAGLCSSPWESVLFTVHSTCAYSP